MKSRILSFLCLGAMVCAFVSASNSNQNLGYEIEVLDHEIVPEFAGIIPEEGKEWYVVSVSIRNRIDPFLVFDYGVEETINILALKDRGFLVAGDGSIYRLVPELFGKDGHLSTSVQLKNSGSRVTGKLAFKVASDPGDCELHWIDESFASIIVPVVGAVPDTLLPEGVVTQENKSVALAVGEHGPMEIANSKPKSGMQFYFVDLWGKSKYKREVKAYFIEERADEGATAEADFCFEYLKSEMCLSLVAEGEYAYAYIPELSLGEEVNPVFVSEKWTRNRLVFEIPKDVSHLQLDALFGKMGLSQGAQSFLRGLSFTVKEGEAKDFPIAEAVTFKDAKLPNELTVSLALVPDLKPWGIGSDEYVGVWARLDNTGTAAGALEPIKRIWFETSGKKFLPKAGQPENAYAPSEMLYLDMGHPRSMLLLYAREEVIDLDPLVLFYSGIGMYQDLEVDFDRNRLSLLEQEAAKTLLTNGSSPSFNETTGAPSTLGTVSNEKKTQSGSLLLDPLKTQLNSSKKPTAPVEILAEVKPEEPEIKLIPYIVELPPKPYDELASLAAQKSIDQMAASTPFIEVLKPTFESFEAELGGISGTETEANDDWDTASRAIINQTFSGTIESKGEDYWKINIPPSATGQDVRFDLFINFPTDFETFKGLYCSLYDSDKKQIKSSWMEIQGSYPFRNLKLVPGDYTILVQNYSSQPDSKYLLQLRSTQYSVMVESEPNNWRQEFPTISAGKVVQGVLGNRDVEDFYKWIVDESVSEKRSDILLSTDSEDHSFRVIVYDEAGEELYWQDGKHNIVLGDFSPAPGTYLIKVSCKEDAPTQYRMQIVERDFRLGGWEREPNDVIHSKNIVAIENFDDGRPEHLGRLEGRYGDFFAIKVKDHNSLYHITVGGPGKVELAYHDFRRGKVASAWSSQDQPAVFADMRLPLGLNYFQISGDAGDYAVNVQQVPIPGETFEWEPNNSQGQAQLMLPGTTYQGRLLSSYDDDWFRFVVPSPMRYHFHLKSPKDSKLQLDFVSPGFSAKRQFATPEEPIVDYSAYLLPGSYLMKIEAPTPSFDFYQFRIDPDPTPEGRVREAIAGLVVQTDESPLLASAFNGEFQEVIQTVRIMNTGSVILKLKVLTTSSNFKVKVGDSAPGSIELNPGQDQTLEIPWIIQPQLSGTEDVRVFVGLETGESIMFAESSIDLSPEAMASRILPEKQLLDKRLAGGFNLNASTLGATPVMEPESLYGDQKPPSSSYVDYLIDGVLANRSFYGYAAVVRMAGEGKTEIVGTSIDLHGRGNLWESAKDFSIDISSDGTTFTEIYSGTLEARTGEQAFVFEKPVKAQFSRLRLHNTHNGKEGQLPHVGEWRMISDPKSSVSGNAQMDLLDKNLGGHWIHGKEQMRVYGFQHNRAARLHSFYWENKEFEAYRGNSHQVKLEISEDSPVGPWKLSKVFDVSGADTAEALSVEIPLENEPWARFVRISWEDSEVQPERGTNDPVRIALFEKAASDDYRSSLGEWQGPTEFAYAEYLEKENGKSSAVDLKRIESSESQPYALAPEKWVSSVAWINEGWEDWYVIDPVTVKKQLQFAVEGKPFVKVAVDLMDEKGNPVAVTESTQGAQRKEFTFLADAGVRYKVHVYEPKRSIIYLWDVSGSMGRFVESIENAVLKFGEEIDPDSEKVHLLPFDEPPLFLLEDWASDSYTLQTTVRNYDAPSSSYAHLNLLAATEMLKDEIGTKAAIVITDCESGRGVNEKLWKMLEEVKPAVFTFQTSDQTSGYRIEQDDMQDWAAVAGGFYHNTRATYELDTAFEKVQAYLRRPAPYRIHLTAPELKPSYIKVKDSRDKSTIRNPEQDGVLLIIDASASMRESLPDGQMKVTAAKAVLNDLVANYLPAGVNFGLRVFGHRGGGNCVSELMIPVAPLDVAAVKQKLMFVRSSSLGNTALAESLSFADEDLKELNGLKRVVVLTDGEETCHGDPAAEIAKLAGAGLDVTVNIVGFTLGDEQVKADYSNWVKSTGGKYFDAQDLEALGVALQEAMTPVELPQFEVYDSAGALVGSGKVGDPQIEVESGVYTVKILDPENPRSESVEAFERSVTIDYQ